MPGGHRGLCLAFGRCRKGWHEQHGGSIEVDTRPGELTEIKVVLPRVAALLPDRS
jgi:hypothetical protein